MTLEQQINHACLQAQEYRLANNEAEYTYWHERVERLYRLIDLEPARGQVYEHGVS